MTDREKLQAIADDPEADPRLRATAVKRLAKAARRSKRPTYHSAGVRRYRVNGVWKLTERIADFDAEGDVVNGWSDRL